MFAKSGRGESSHMKRRKYRIRSKIRFTVSVMVMAVMAACGLGAFTGFNASAAAEKAEYVNIRVCGGDTLWDIAGTYKDESTDIREAVYEICSINDIEAEELVPGMMISVPEDL